MDAMRLWLASARPAVRWTVALAWTGLVVALMLGPSSAVHPLSALFGGTEITDAIGHVALYGVLTVFWWWARIERWPPRRALRFAVVVAVCLGVVTETVQSLLPDRGVSLLDFGANWLGVGIGAAWLSRRRR